jgi:hypothetical protein
MERSDSLNTFSPDKCIHAVEKSGLVLIIYVVVVGILLLRLKQPDLLSDQSLTPIDEN